MGASETAGRCGKARTAGPEPRGQDRLVEFRRMELVTVGFGSVSVHDVAAAGCRIRVPARLALVDVFSG